MSEAKPNGVAKPEDFRKAAEASAFEEPQRVVLPKCGFPVMLRRPRPIAFTLLGGSLPQSLATRVSQSGVRSPESETPDSELRTPDLSRDELIQVSRFWTNLFKAIFVQPGLSLTPGPEEIHPAWLPVEDQIFVIRWAVGEVASDGSDLAAFRGGQP
jgi:hypothetical protein